jgi:hypothetical protein
MKTTRCIECNCEAVSHTVERHGRFEQNELTTFSCGARERKFTDREKSIGRIEFEGCTC